MTGSAHSRSKKVLMIGLDGADPALLEQGMDQGRLPNLRRLRTQGTYGRIASTAEWLTSSVWPSFLTGMPPGEHGGYHYLQWRAERMQFQRWDSEWIPLIPFWRALSKAGPRVITLDVPAADTPQGFDGIELSDWGALPQIRGPSAYPARMSAWVTQRYGASLHRMSRELSHELFAPQRMERLLAQADLFVTSTRRMAEVAAALLREEPWDLFISVISAAHRGGHELWDASGVSDGDGPEVERRLRDALWRTYAACDEAVGRHLEAVGASATVLVFGLHGMTANTSRSDLLDPMLRRIVDGTASRTASAKPGALTRLRRLVPDEWRMSLKSRLPLDLQDRLSVFWRAGSRNWATTRAFPLTADVDGYVRINLRGREAAGTVEPGAEYEDLCRRIAEGMRSFIDADTGEPIVDDMAFSDSCFPGSPRRNDLPDLIVRWRPTPAARHRQLVSPRFGALDWRTPGKMPNGRSGNHNANGFLLAVGDGITAGSSLSGGHILDLPPTVYALFDLSAPSHMTGRPIREVTSTGARVS